MKELVWTSPTFDIIKKEDCVWWIPNFRELATKKNWCGKYKCVTKKHLSIFFFYNFE